jgi:uncharacterized protein (TIGR02118 family)
MLFDGLVAARDDCLIAGDEHVPRQFDQEKIMTTTVTVMYPNTPGSKFDMDYYLANHIPLVNKLWGDKLISVRAVKGLATPDPDIPAPYQVMAILEMENPGVLQQLIAEHGQEVMGDIPKFTDVQPVVQISENLG